MMRSRCKQLELWLAEPEAPMPEALKAHIERCPACAERWQEEQRYRQLLQAVRSVPVPSTQLRWEQVQRRLAERAVQRAGKLRWQVAMAWVVGIWMIVALGVGTWWWSMHTKAPFSSYKASSAQNNAPVEKSPAKPVEIAAVPTASSETPSLAQTPVLRESSLQPRTKSLAPQASPNFRFSSSEGIIGLRTFSARGGSPMPPRESPETNTPLEIEILPVEPIVPQGSEQSEYLALNYQQHPTAEKKEDALIYSF